MDAVYGALIAVAVAGCATVETRVKSADRAIDMGNLDSAERQLTEAARKTGGDPREVALIERARRKLRRERLRAQVATIGVTPSEQAFYEIEAFRARVHDAGGDAAMERTLDDAMLRQKRHAVERVEELAGAGSYRSAQSLAVMIAGLPSPLPPDLQQRIRVAMSAATQHHFKLSEEAGAQWPLAQRVHLGLAVAYQGGTLAPATQLAAPYARGVTVRTNGVGCPNAVAIRSALEATGANRAEIDITFSSCHERDDATTASQHATWTQQVYSHTERQPSSRQVCGMERRESSLGAASNDCTVNTWTQPPSLSCKPVTVSYNVEVCRTVTTYIDMPIYKPVQRSGVREITTHTSSVSIAGTAVARLAGREVQKAFNQSARSTDTSYPAIGTLAAKGATHARAKALTPGVQTKVIAEIEAALRELFAPQVQDAIAAARALAGGRVAEEEEAWVRAILLGSTDAGPFQTRYGLTAQEVRTMFATDPRLPGKRLELPYVPPPQREIEIPTSSIDRKTLFTRTWLAPPMVNALWMQAELGHVSVAEVAAGTETYGESSFLLGARVGGRPLTWKSNAFGPVLTDDLSGAFAFGMTVDFEEATTGGVLAASATYSLGAGYRSRAFGGIVAGVRPTASVLYIDSAAAIGTAVPLFARIDVPFGNGSLAVDGYGASLAGKAHTGLAVHIAWRGKSRKQHTRFLTFRYETRDLDVNVNDMDLPGVSSTMITGTFGIGL